MDMVNSTEMAQPPDEIPGLNLDFSNFDLSQFVSADANVAPTADMHMHPISGPHSTHTSPMLNPIQDHSQGHRVAQMATNSEIARLQYSLDQQRRMNELNQLQNRILQQQLEIMGCTPPSHLPVGYPGLMTPVSSTELRPMAYDSNTLTSALGNNVDLYHSLLSPAMTPHMASSTSHPSPFPQTHGTPHFLSPLTSPALTPSPNTFDSFRQAPMSAIPSPAQMSFPPLPSPSFGPSGTNSRPKRSATTEVDSARKRASPIVKPTPPSKMTTKRTPRMRPRGDSIAQSRASPLPSPRPSASIDPTGDVPVSTPSPVDLSTTTFSMPPPVVPISRTSPSQELDTVMEHVPSADGTPVVSACASPSLPPVAAATPASLMNLGRLATQPTGLKHGNRVAKDSVEGTDSADSSQSAVASPSKATVSKKDKTKEVEQVKAAPKSKASVAKSNSGVRQSPAILPAISPAIKPNMPSSFTAEAIAHLSTKSNYQNTLEGRAVALGITSSSSGSSYPPDGRKTSHKAAEQKRRDSLKAGFDDLRLLLPPIALSACAELDPGAAPPRGPPRNVPGGEDNPNRAVSKLALLRFSNEWIVKLGRRVERRDQAIEDLKKEIQMLREKLGPDADLPDGFNLDANLDKIEEESEEGKSIRAASRPTEKIKIQKPGAIAEQEEEDGEDGD